MSDDTEKVVASKVNVDSEREITESLNSDGRHEQSIRGQQTHAPSALSSFERSDTSIIGWRYWFTMAGLYFGAFLVLLDSTIINTALVAITNDLQDFEHATWIVNAFSLALSGSLILWSQFSHSLGRKSSLLVASLLFVAFSAGCGCAQTSNQLIVLRAFQGLAGAGLAQSPTVIIAEVVPPSSFPKYIAFMSLTSATAFGTGPLIGGGIATYAHWRWIFWMNIPAGVVVFIMNFIAMPNGLPHHHKPKSERPVVRLASLKRLDIGGGFLFLCASTFGVTAFQEAEVSFPWRSPAIICLLVFSILSWIAFVFWQRLVTLRFTNIVPIMTWKFFRRKPLAMLLCSALIGLPLFTVLVVLPQGFQIIQGLSAWQAGVRLLPYIVVVPVGSVIGSAMSGKFKLNAAYGMAAGALMQLTAAICFATTSSELSGMDHVPRKQYGFQVLLGLGTGLAYASNFNGMPFVLAGDRALIPAAMGANSQLRYLGGALGVAVVTAVLNTTLRSQLPAFLDSHTTDAVLHSTAIIRGLAPDLKEMTVKVFVHGFILEWKVICGFLSLQFVMVLLTL